MTLNPADLAAACLQAAADDPGAQSRYLAVQTLFSLRRPTFQAVKGASAVCAWWPAHRSSGLRPEGWPCCRVEAAAEAFLQMSQQQVAVPLETLVQTFINAVTGAHVTTVS